MRKDCNEPPLTPKMERFVQEYLRDLNGTQAAIRAGYSPRTAKSQASDLLGKPGIQRAIAAARERLAHKFEITRERVMLEYARLAFSDPRQLYREDGSLRSVPELGDDIAAALAGFEVTRQETVEVDEDGEVLPAPTVTTKVKWADKRSALDSICRVMGWNQDRLKAELSGTDGGPIEVSATVDVSGLSLEQLRVLASIKV